MIVPDPTVGAYCNTPLRGRHKPLPPGWRWARLGELGQFDAGGTPPKDHIELWGVAYPFVTGADITELSVSTGRAFLTREGLYSGRTAVCGPGTVLIVTRTRVGRVGIAATLMGASQDITPYRCGPSLNPQYVCRYLHSKGDYLIQKCRGATILGLTRDVLEELRIPLPPLEEQRRIAARLSEQMAQVEKMRQAARAQLEAVNALPGALLDEVFGGFEP